MSQPPQSSTDEQYLDPKLAAATAAASDNAVAGVESEAALQSRLQKRDQSDNISSSRENSPSRGGQQEHVALDLALTPDEKEGKKGKKKKKKNKQVIEDAGDEDEVSRYDGLVRLIRVVVGMVCAIRGLVRSFRTFAIQSIV